MFSECRGSISSSLEWTRKEFRQGLKDGYILDEEWRGRNELWQKEGMPTHLRRWEGIKVGMLEGQVQDGLFRAGLGREAVGTVVGKAIWGGSMDGLEIWVEKLSFHFVHLEEFSKTFEQRTTCWKSPF